VEGVDMKGVGSGWSRQTCQLHTEYSNLSHFIFHFNWRWLSHIQKSSKTIMPLLNCFLRTPFRLWNDIGICNYRKVIS